MDAARPLGKEVMVGSATSNPRDLLTEWANSSDEWVRYIVRQVLDSGRAIGPDEADHAYKLFRQEKSLDSRTLSKEPLLAATANTEEVEEPLAITCLSDVTGVNALVSGAVIEPHAGLTILFGENGTGKTGYSRIFKALAASRTADVILGDIDAASEQDKSATIRYTLGAAEREFVWSGEQGVPPFTRMSIFDSPSVNFHVDEDLEYVYVPAALALFNHVISGIKAVQAQVDDARKSLASGATSLLSRFPRESSVYPLVETLGAATDLDELKARADDDPKIDQRIDLERKAIAALEANAIAPQIALRERGERVLTQAASMLQMIVSFDAAAYNAALQERAALVSDYRAFRGELFRAADLPSEPEATWEAFVAAGDLYRRHLESTGAHDADRCLYCRQPLGQGARDLVAKYGDYLADKISKDIEDADNQITALTQPIRSLASSEVQTFVTEYRDRDDKPAYYEALSELTGLLDLLRSAAQASEIVELARQDAARTTKLAVDEALLQATTELGLLREQASNRAEVLAEKRRALAELIAAAELSKSWTMIESRVRDAKEANRLEILAQPLPNLSRTVTGLAKTASDELINQSFDALFMEECEALRAPVLKVEFVGRQGRAQRRKVLKGKYKPSRVLSEGEQKVLALADFLAEARLAGITAPVIFDDPVSSLDHRRIDEVARRIADLAEQNQVIVFTHDIFFATTLLALFEKSKRCAYFQVTDEDGKGKVTRATGPRWDTLASIRKNINETIAAAKAQEGEARSALVRTGYDWVRAWCEVFTETELLQGVTQRYRPNVRMTALPNIKTGALSAAIRTVTEVFEDACRYIDGHSQPLPTLGISPTLASLEAQWRDLEECRKKYNDSPADAQE